jgi:serine/threonine protein kinase
MTLDERLVDLLMRAEDLREQGQRVTAEELCRDCPELLPRLEPLLRGADEVEKLLDLSACVADGVPTLVPGPSAVAAPRVRGYTIRRELGRGGMGVVYDAEQEALGRRVALKVLSALPGQSAERVARFQREVRAAARLHHTNIVPVFEVGQDGGVWFYSMQYIPGRPLNDVLRLAHRSRRARQAPVAPRPPGIDPASGGPESTLSRLVTPTGAHEPAGGAAADPSTWDARGLGLLSPDAEPYLYFREVARAGQQVAEALACAHAHGVLHRDIKPANLLLDDSGRVWVTDFGLAKIDNDDLTHSGALLGTLRYMAPEQVRGTPDARSDVYSLGLTLYELLVLEPAFDAPDHLRLLEQIAEREPRRPRSLDPRVPRDLETIVLKAIV